LLYGDFSQNALTVNGTLKFGLTASPTQSNLNNYAEYKTPVDWIMSGGNVSGEVRFVRVGGQVQVSLSNFTTNITTPDTPYFQLPLGFFPTNTIIQNASIWVYNGSSTVAGRARVTGTSAGTDLTVYVGYDSTFPTGTYDIFNNGMWVTFSYTVLS
jgi:hypothetical protein